jgi:hypothetical protein
LTFATRNSDCRPLPPPLPITSCGQVPAAYFPLKEALNSRNLRYKRSHACRIPPGMHPKETYWRSVLASDPACKVRYALGVFLKRRGMIPTQKTARTDRVDCAVTKVTEFKSRESQLRRSGGLRFVGPSQGGAQAVKKDHTEGAPNSSTREVIIGAVGGHWDPWRQRGMTDRSVAALHRSEELRVARQDNND